MRRKYYSDKQDIYIYILNRYNSKKWIKRETNKCVNDNVKQLKLKRITNTLFFQKVQIVFLELTLLSLDRFKIIIKHKYKWKSNSGNKKWMINRKKVLRII